MQDVASAAASVINNLINNISSGLSSIYKEYNIDIRTKNATLHGVNAAYLQGIRDVQSFFDLKFKKNKDIFRSLILMYKNNPKKLYNDENLSQNDECGLEDLDSIFDSIPKDFDQKMDQIFKGYEVNSNEIMPHIIRVAYLKGLNDARNVFLSEIKKNARTLSDARDN